MTGLATSRKHASTRCVQILPGTIPCPRPSPLIRSIPAPMSAARLSRPRRASRHLSRSMKSNTEAPKHGDWSEFIDAALNCTSKISSLRRQIDIVHKQCVNASLAECDDRVGGRADNWLAVVEGRIDDDRYSGSCKKAGYKIVKARI